MRRVAGSLLVTWAGSQKFHRSLPGCKDLIVIRAETIVELLDNSRSVLVDEAGNERTCPDLISSGRFLADRLLAAGLNPGDRIAVQMTNTWLYLDLLSAAAQAGFVIMSVNLRFGDALADSLIERSGSRVIIRCEQDLALAPTPPTPPTATAPGEPTELADTASVGQLGQATSPDSRYVIFTTSGTTSAPKLVVHRQRSIAVHAGEVAQAFAYTPDSVVLLALPLCGVFGFTTLWGAVAGHSRIVLSPKFDPAVAAKLIEQHRVTSMHGSDDMFHRLLETDADLSSIVAAGYARFNTALDGIVTRCDARGVPIAGLYGMSEVLALLAWRGSDGPVEDRSRPGGQLVPSDSECRIVDDELQLRGPTLFEGYLADGGSEIDAELTADNFDGPWFKTGDLASIDGHRSFEYITRIGDVMRLGGFLVAPAEIETVLMQHGEIDQAQVVAVDQELGTRPVAFVITTSAKPVDEAEVIAHCNETLARFKCPIRVIAVDAFPVTEGPNGVKIQRAELRRLGEQLVGRGLR